MIVYVAIRILHVIRYYIVLHYPHDNPVERTTFRPPCNTVNSTNILNPPKPQPRPSSTFQAPVAPCVCTVGFQKLMFWIFFQTLGLWLLVHAYMSWANKWWLTRCLLCIWTWDLRPSVCFFSVSFKVYIYIYMLCICVYIYIYIFEIMRTDHSPDRLGRLLFLCTVQSNNFYS